MQQSVPQAPQSAQDFAGGNKTALGEEFRARKLNTPLDKLTRNTSGRRSTTRTDRKRGRYVQSRPMQGRIEDLAFDATMRTAAPHQLKRKEEAALVPGGKLRAFHIKRPDFMRKVRVKRVSNLIMFVVDASWSMAVAERMQATKGAIMSLLTDAYQRRDRVGLIVFQKNSATLILPPTSSVELAQKALRDIPVGGKTPLTAGLTLSYHVIMRELRIRPEVSPLLIILTDGAGNVSMSNLPPQVEAYQMASQIAEEKIRSIVINMEHVAFDQGLARKLAEALEGVCLSLADLKAESLTKVVKAAL